MTAQVQTAAAPAKKNAYILIQVPSPVEIHKHMHIAMLQGDCPYKHVRSACRTEPMTLSMNKSMGTASYGYVITTECMAQNHDIYTHKHIYIYTYMYGTKS